MPPTGRWIALGIVAVAFVAMVTGSRCRNDCQPDSACWDDRGLRERERPY